MRPADTRRGARLLRAGETQLWRRIPARLAYASLASNFPRPLVPPVPSLDPLAHLAELTPFPRDLDRTGAGQAGKMSMFSFLATGIKKYYDIGETLGKGSFGKLCT